MCYPAIRMIRKNQNQSSHHPLYRQVVFDALRLAWHEKRLWFFAVMAALLQTGGVVDVFAASVRRVTVAAADFSVADFWRDFFGISLFPMESSGGSWFAQVQIWEGVLFGSLLLFAVASLSLISQGAIVAGLGARYRGRELTLRECFQAGLNAFGPIMLLNVFTLGLIRLASFLFLVPLSTALDSGSVWAMGLAVIAGMVFFVLVLALTIIHVFGLNALVLQEASLREAVARAMTLLRRGWLVALEASFVLFVIGIGLLGVGLLTAFIMAIPLFFGSLFALLAQAPAVALIFQSLLIVMAIVVVAVLGAFAIIFQYAVWQQLYRRLGEGGAAAKLHRWVKWLTGDYRATRF